MAIADIIPSLISCLEAESNEVVRQAALDLLSKLTRTCMYSRGLSMELVVDIEL